MDESSLVVFGALRSGSTMLRLMIDSHPSLHCNDEHDYLFDYVWFDQTTQKWRLDRDGLLLDRIFLSQEIPCPETDDGKAAIQSMIASLEAKDSGRLVLMLHRNLETMITLLDNPKFIHLIRDPRDVAASSIGMGWAGNVYYGADHWIRTETQWKQISPKLPPENIFTLRFEQLIENPVEKLTDLCRFVGLEYSELMLEYHKNSTYEPVDPKLGSQWRKKRTEKEIALIENRVGSLLSASGFEPINPVPPKLGGREKLGLWIENKLYRWRAKVERYGLIDSLWSTVAHRLGVERSAKSLIFRMHEQTNQHLK